MARAVGIDLGTTNSVVAALENGEAVVIPNAEGHRTTPSVVAFTAKGEVLVGEVARRQAITNPDRTFASTKRHMGTNWSTTIDGKTYRAQEIAARILMKLKRDAEAFLGEDVTQAVITVPAYFNDAQRTATKEAGQIAGLEVLRVINEPTAAAVSFGVDKMDDDSVVLVFDLGGGTLDVSVLEIGGGVFAVKSTHGDTRLGGDDWDKAIVKWLVDGFKADNGVDLSADSAVATRVHEAAEKAKMELSHTVETSVNLPFVTATASGPLHLEETLTRTNFENLTADLRERCQVPFRQALSDAGIDTGDLTHVVLVGGSTRMPAVGDLVAEMTGAEPNRTVNPDEAVAMGAALQSAALRGETTTDLVLLDVTPLSLGIETKGGVMTRLIERNTTIPTKVSDVFSTAADDQESVDVHVLQGEREMASFNKTLGRFSLRDIPPARAGVPKVEVTFDIDADGIVHVSARDQATGAEQSMVISGQSNLSDADIAAMVADAEAHAAEDRARKAEAAARNNGEAAVQRAERMLADHASKAPAGVVESIKVARDNLNTALAASDTDAITKANNELTAQLRELSEHIYTAAGSTSAEEDNPAA